ncbi:unnamed protein product [marine sediment metagenome]|uniref:Uncharacterized protein n=1 Tax=marine sediment metagenome TaxID=412755 RepID=X1FFD2_9ZZZZ
MAFRRLQTIGGALGSLVTSLIQRAIAGGIGIAETLGIIRPAAPEIEPAAAAFEFGQVRLREEQQTEVAALQPHEAIPRELFTESNVPWKQAINYTVQVYGRASGRDPKVAKRGQFNTQEYNITASRPMTIAEVLEETTRLVGSQENYPLMEILSAKVVAAEISVGREWTW